MSGCRFNHCSQVVCTAGTISRLVLTNRPLTPWLKNWLHRVFDWWSYMTSAFMISLPDTPKVCSWPSISRAYTMPVKQRGHQVTAMALPPTVSLTISCRESKFSG